MNKQSNTEIKRYADSDFDAFAQMVGVYFIEDLKEHLNYNPPVRMCKAMIQSVKDDITHLDILRVDDTPIGFIMYQVDSPKSDWCEKEGYGFIREMYIRKDHRRHGYGKTLATHAENQLKKLVVSHIYLTAGAADGSIDFWLSVGYADTGEVCDRNNNNILIKQA